GRAWVNPCPATLQVGYADRSRSNRRARFAQAVAACGGPETVRPLPKSYSWAADTLANQVWECSRDDRGTSMKTLLMVGAAIVALAGPAAAADMPVKAAAPPPPVWNWTGIYIGVHGGAAWGTKTFDYNDLTVGAPFLWQASVPVNGFLGGGQIGFN